MRSFPGGPPRLLTATMCFKREMKARQEETWGQAMVRYGNGFAMTLGLPLSLPMGIVG